MNIPVWVLLLLLSVAWLLWLFACMAEVAVSEASKGIPEGERRGVSILPGIPLFPLVFWGIALLIDQFMYPWGTNVVGGLHLVLSLFWLISAIRDMRKLKNIDGAS